MSNFPIHNNFVAIFAVEMKVYPMIVFNIINLIKIMKVFKMFIRKYKIYLLTLYFTLTCVCFRLIKNSFKNLHLLLRFIDFFIKMFISVFTHIYLYGFLFLFFYSSLFLK